MMVDLLQFLLLTLSIQPIWTFATDINILRINGGRNISIEDASFMVAMVILTTDNKITFCGGSIIHEKFILTAGHCFRKSVNPLNAGGAVGIDDLDNEDGIDFTVDKKFCTRISTTVPYYDDICLLKLNKSLEFGSQVAPIKLPEKDLKLEEGTLVNVTGWDKTENSSNVVINLQQGTESIMSDESCLKNYPNITTNSQFCAGSNGQGYCSRYSGGPVISNGVQVGVVTSSDGCSDEYGAVYTKVSSYLDWIHEAINENLP
ncbi:chymotrypsin-2-like [Leguminivora glycinivorella]|uniref:chymotrypsin-2-like n=1 Tax=Leguminivora glycinivorella TaxID=1035111 RepID=UPI00200F4F96|nr:chymotrypsin-2-like [Leguminivora glycinivorella]